MDDKGAYLMTKYQQKQLEKKLKKHDKKKYDNLKERDNRQALNMLIELFL